MSFQVRRNSILSGVALCTLALLITTGEYLKSNQQKEVQDLLPIDSVPMDASPAINWAANPAKDEKANKGFTHVMFHKAGAAAEYESDASSLTDMDDASNTNAITPASIDEKGHSRDTGMLLEYKETVAELAPYSVAAESIPQEINKSVLIASTSGDPSADIFADGASYESAAETGDSGPGVVAGAYGIGGGFGGYLAAVSAQSNTSGTQSGASEAALAHSSGSGEQAMQIADARPGVASAGFIAPAAQGVVPSAVLGLDLTPLSVFARGSVLTVNAMRDPGPGHGPSAITPQAGGQQVTTVSTLLPPPPDSRRSIDNSTAQAPFIPFAFSGGGGGGGGGGNSSANSSQSSSTSNNSSSFAPRNAEDPVALSSAPEPSTAVLVVPILLGAWVVWKKRRVQLQV